MFSPEPPRFGAMADASHRSAVFCWQLMVRTSIGALTAALVISACTTEQEPEKVEVWTPGVHYRAPAAPEGRGLIDLRGLVHAHSAHSHDACDGEPIKDGVYDESCMTDFRTGVCQVKHDFVFLTDHEASFAHVSFVDGLLYREAQGDQLVERDGAARSNRMACSDGSTALIMAGFEAGTMTVGLTKHLLTDEEQRKDLYNSARPETMEQLRAEADAIVLLQHTEDWTVDQLDQLPIDGFEMYNLHANTIRGAATVLELAVFLSDEEQTDNIPKHPDLIAFPIWNEDSRYLERWAGVLARGKKRVTTMGTDCHQNTFPTIMSDGERGDSYRRMMSWLSNHLLVRAEADGSWDDRHLKEALRAGRLYGAFELVGYPVGFDFHAEATGAIHEMGEESALAAKPTLVVKQPKVQNLDPSRNPPVLTTRILRATDDGFVEVASGDGDLSFRPTEPGAYRAEVRMIPKHVLPDMGPYYRPMLVEKEIVWIYSNPIYVR